MSSLLTSSLTPAAFAGLKVLFKHGQLFVSINSRADNFWTLCEPLGRCWKLCSAHWCFTLLSVKKCFKLFITTVCACFMLLQLWKKLFADAKKLLWITLKHQAAPPLVSWVWKLHWIYHHLLFHLKDKWGDFAGSLRGGTPEPQLHHCISTGKARCLSKCMCELACS